jgi:hypothetical protein
MPETSILTGAFTVGEGSNSYAVKACNAARKCSEWSANATITGTEATTSTGTVSCSAQTSSGQIALNSNYSNTIAITGTVADPKIYYFDAGSTYLTGPMPNTIGRIDYYSGPTATTISRTYVVTDGALPGNSAVSAANGNNANAKVRCLASPISYSIVAPTAVAIPGKCGTTNPLQCEIGTATGSEIQAGKTEWYCDGPNNGPRVQCSIVTGLPPNAYNSAPELPVVEVSNGSTANGFYFNISANDPEKDPVRYHVSWKAISPSQIDTYYPIPTDSFTPGDSKSLFAMGVTSPGAHSITVEATDSKGATSPLKTFTFYTTCGSNGGFTGQVVSMTASGDACVP